MKKEIRKFIKNNLHILLILVTVVCVVFSSGCSSRNTVTHKDSVNNTTTKSGESDVESSTKENEKDSSEEATDNSEATSDNSNATETSADTSNGTATENNADSATNGSEDNKVPEKDNQENTSKESNTSTEGNNSGNSSNNNSQNSTTTNNNQDSSTATNNSQTTTEAPTTTTSGSSSGSNDQDTVKEYGPFPKPTVNVGINSADTVDSAITKIINNNVKSSMSIEEKIKILHDYLVYTVDYDVEGFMKYVATGDMEGSFSGDVFTAKGALINKVAVCQGYAEAFKLMMDKLGVKNIIVYGTGNGNSHAWNMVQLNGYWYHVDVTFDDPCRESYDASGNYVMSNISGGSNISYTYFLTTDNIITNNHIIDKNETVSMNSGIISSYPSSKANDKIYLEMVYPWFEISGAGELSKLSNYFDKGIYEVRIVADKSVYNSNAFWSNIQSFGYGYSASIGSLGEKMVVFLKITK